MKIMSTGPNPATIYHYMRCKGYTPDFKMDSGKQVITFTKTLHSAEFPTIPSLKGLVVVHKIEIDIWYGCAKKHWLENRYIPISSWDYFNLLETLFKESIVFYNETKEWMKNGWRNSK